MLGGLFALLSAALFAYNNAATRRGVLTGSTLQGMAISVPLGAVLFGLASLAAGSTWMVTTFSWKALACFAAAGFAHFLFGRYFNYRAIAAIGTNLAGPIQQWEVLVTLALALVFLGETLTPLKVLAIALLILGPVLAARDAGTKPSSAPDAAKTGGKPVFTPRYTEGYICAFVTIFGYGSSAVFIRAGLGDTTIGAGLAAGFVSYVVATAIIAVVIVALGKLGHVREIDSTAAKWFAFAGLLVFLSHMFRYMALALLPVTIVAPILRVQQLFRFYFSGLMSPNHEIFSQGVLMGTVVSVIGAVLLSLPTDMVLGWLALPEAMKALLRWHWPA